MIKSKHVTKSGLCLALALPILISLLASKPGNVGIKKQTQYLNSRDPGKPILLPSFFISGERFYIKLPTLKGDTILGYCDTGGGISMVMPATIDKLNLQTKIQKAKIKGIIGINYVPFNDVVSSQDIPPPIQLPGMNLSHHFKKVTDPFLYVPPANGEMKMMTESMHLDVFFGQDFFMGKAWTMDYIHRKIWVNTPLASREEGNPGVQRIGIRKDSKGKPTHGHPSMYIEVDGEKIDVLFDTGATIILSDNGKKALNTADKTIGGSFIAVSVFEKWHKEHPDWKVYEKADMSRDIIEVPKVNIGGHLVGPVLFAERPDENWSKGMISSMDKVVKGAIGGSGLKYLKVQIDYNSELIKFDE